MSHVMLVLSGKYKCCCILYIVKQEICKVGNLSTSYYKQRMSTKAVGGIKMHLAFEVAFVLCSHLENEDVIQLNCLLYFVLNWPYIFMYSCINIGKHAECKNVF